MCLSRNISAVGFALVTLLSVFAAAPAAAGGPFFGGFGGVNLTQKGDFGGGEMSYYPGLVIGEYGGYAFDFGLRLGGELSTRFNETDEFNGFSDDDNFITSWALMGTAFYDFKNPSPFTPYIGGGVGFAVIEFEDTFGNEDADVVFAGQLGAGISLAVARIVLLTFDYRYFITEDPEIDVGFGPFDFEYSNHSFLFGVRIQF